MYMLAGKKKRKKREYLFISSIDVTLADSSEPHHHLLVEMPYIPVAIDVGLD
jgi:hypothetical protein